MGLMDKWALMLKVADDDGQSGDLALGGIGGGIAGYAGGYGLGAKAIKPYEDALEARREGFRTKADAHSNKMVRNTFDWHRNNMARGGGLRVPLDQANMRSDLAQDIVAHRQATAPPQVRSWQQQELRPPLPADLATSLRGAQAERQPSRPMPVGKRVADNVLMANANEASRVGRMNTAFRNAKSRIGGLGRHGGGVLGMLGGAALGHVAQSMLQPSKEGMDKQAAPNPKGAMNFVQSLWRPAANVAKGAAKDPGHMAQAGRMALGGLAGNMTGDAMAPQTSFNWGGQRDANTGKVEGGWNINPLGIVAGAMHMNPAMRRTAVGQTMAAPLNRAFVGHMAGGAVDSLAPYTPIGDTNGRGSQLGAWAGLGSGFAGNRIAGQRDQILASARSQMNAAKSNKFFGANPAVNMADVAKRTKDQIGNLDSSSWTGRINQAGKVMDHVNEGINSAFTAPFNRAGQFFTGGNIARAKNVPTQGANLAARRIGQLSLGVPAAAMAGGAAYHGLTGSLKGELPGVYGALREQATMDADDWMRQRGMLNAQGKFDPTGGAGNALGQFVNPLLSMLGHQNPEQMGGGDKAMALAGPAMAAGGAFAGNPWMTAAGIGTMAYPHMTGQTQGQNFHAPGQYGQAPPNAHVARNELDAQRSKQMGHMDGQGYL